MTCSRSDVFCDWLDVTCSPNETFAYELELFMAVHGYPVTFYDRKTGHKVFRVGSGTLKLERKEKFERASASGAVVHEFRSKGIFRDYVNLVGSVPHKVTRLDAALDVYTDAPPVLRALETRYPDDRFRFGRKALKVTRLYSARESDQALTGTWYVGHRSSARVTARVYDKAQEALDKRAERLEPTTRYELTFAKDYGCSLFDVLNPRSLFYSHAAERLLPSDGYYEPWESRGCVPWTSEPRDTMMTLQRFESRVAASPDLAELVRLSTRFGPAGKAIIMRHFEQQLDSAYRAQEHTGSADASSDAA